MIHLDQPIDPEKLAPALLRYTFPSRYCDSDMLQDFAWQQFGQYQHGAERVLAICDWLHHNIEYRTGSGSPDLTAFDVIERGYGVCRDFAHCGVALCRTFNLPTRYVSGFVPDIACYDPGTPMDFHAYFEVYMGGRWQVFDARFNTPRTGRVRIAACMTPPLVPFRPATERPSSNRSTCGPIRSIPQSVASEIRLILRGASAARLKSSVHQEA